MATANAKAGTYDILHSGGLNGTTFSGVTGLSPNFAVSLWLHGDRRFSHTYGATRLQFRPQPQSAGRRRRAQRCRQWRRHSSGGPCQHVHVDGSCARQCAEPAQRRSGDRCRAQRVSADERVSHAHARSVRRWAVRRRAWCRWGNRLCARSGGVAARYRARLCVDPQQGAARPSFDQRWTAWGAGYGGSSNTRGDPTAGTNNLTASTFGYAGGMDYHFTPDTRLALRWPAVGPTGDSPITSGAVAVMRFRLASTASHALVPPISAARSPLPITGSRPIALRSVTSLLRASSGKATARALRAVTAMRCCLHWA